MLRWEIVVYKRHMRNNMRSFNVVVNNLRRIRGDGGHPYSNDKHRLLQFEHRDIPMSDFPGIRIAFKNDVHRPGCRSERKRYQRDDRANGI